MSGTRFLAPFALISALIGPAPSRAEGPPPAPPSKPPAEEEMVPDDRLGTRVAPLLLLGRPDVRADLQLRPDQEAMAREAIADLYAQALATRGLKGEAALAARKAIDESQGRWLDEMLSDSQRARIDQIDLQWEGPSALISRGVLAEELGLNAAQKAAIEAAIVRRNELRKDPKQAREAERQLARTALDALDPTQRDRWRAMLGRPFVPEVVATRQEPANR